MVTICVIATNNGILLTNNEVFTVNKPLFLSNKFILLLKKLQLLINNGFLGSTLHIFLSELTNTKHDFSFVGYENEIID